MPTIVTQQRVCGNFRTVPIEFRARQTNIDSYTYSDIKPWYSGPIPQGYSTSSWREDEFTGAAYSLCFESTQNINPSELKTLTTFDNGGFIQLSQWAVSAITGTMVQRSSLSSFVASIPNYSFSIAFNGFVAYRNEQTIEGGVPREADPYTTTLIKSRIYEISFLVINGLQLIPTPMPTPTPAPTPLPTPTPECDCDYNQIARDLRLQFKDLFDKYLL